MKKTVFWAGLLILVGILLICRQVFFWQFSIWRVGVGLLFLWIAVSLLFRPGYANRPKNSEYTTYTSSSYTTYTPTGDSSADAAAKDGSASQHQSPPGYMPPRSYNNTCSSTTVDLRTVPLPGSYSVQCSFGQTKVLLPANVRVRTHSNISFGSVKFPSGSGISNSTTEAIVGPQGASQTMDLDLRVEFGEIMLMY